MIRIVKQKTLDNLHEQIEYWRSRAKFILNVPYLDLDGVGKVQIYCEDSEQADKVRKLLEDKK